MSGVTFSSVRSPVPALTTGLVFRAGSASAGTGGKGWLGVGAADECAQPDADGDTEADAAGWLDLELPNNHAAPPTTTSTASALNPAMRTWRRRFAAARRAAAAFLFSRFVSRRRAAGVGRRGAWLVTKRSPGRGGSRSRQGRISWRPAGVPAAGPHGTAAPGPAGLGRRRALRDPVPRPAHRRPEAGRRRAAAQPRRPGLRTAPGPDQAALGAVARRGPRRRPLGGHLEGAPLHDRRRGRLGPGRAAARHQPGRGASAGARRLVARAGSVHAAAARRGTARRGGCAAAAAGPGTGVGARRAEPGPAARLHPGAA